MNSAQDDNVVQHTSPVSASQPVHQTKSFAGFIFLPCQ